MREKSKSSLPNIIYILSDDLGYLAIQIMTPQMGQLEQDEAIIHV